MSYTPDNSFETAWHHIQHISMTDDWPDEETDDPLYADQGS
jgi:hypothetical protein